jgi:flagellar assembly protein FliH
MALIRHANAGTMARDAVVLDLGDLARQAEALRARARAQAELIVKEAQAERQRILSGAAEQGYQEGLARGLEEGRREGLEAGRSAAVGEYGEKLAALEEAWSSTLGEFTQMRQQMLIEARQDVLRLGLRIGALITRRTIEGAPEVVVDQLAAVLGLVLQRTQLVVAAHPDDLPLLTEALPQLAERLQTAGHVELIADAGLERGSCVARTPRGGEIDASIDSQLRRIVEGLLPGAAENPSDGEGAL